MQPLDQGIIQNFKILYRKEIVKTVIAKIEEQGKVPISILQAMRMTDKAWKNVSQSTIIHCFKKCRFSVPIQIDSQHEDGHLDNASIEAKWKIVTNHYQAKGLTFQEFINFDDDVAVIGTFFESDIIASLNYDKNEENSDDDYIDDSKDESCTTKETKNAITSLRLFF